MKLLKFACQNSKPKNWVCRIADSRRLDLLFGKILGNLICLLQYKPGYNSSPTNAVSYHVQCEIQQLYHMDWKYFITNSMHYFLYVTISYCKIYGL